MAFKSQTDASQHTISIPLKQEMTSRDIRTLFQDRYAGEKLVKVRGEPPLVKAISGRHGVVCCPRHDEDAAMLTWNV